MFIFFFGSRAIPIIVLDKYKTTISRNPEESNTDKVGDKKTISVIVVDDKVELGKKLFFDTILSKDGTISCASCHKPDHGFSDDKAVSLGIRGQKGDRNTPTVFNTKNLKFLFWDGRAKSLEEQALGPIENPIEMGEKIENVLKKLNSHSTYKKEFKAVYGSSPITKDQLANVISGFERTLISRNTNYDHFITGDKNALSPSAKRGYDLFFGKAMCIACHKGLDFTDGDFHNIGLPATDDKGRAKISGKKEDTRKFKTPTLREVANTAPYFHNGQFETLEQVIAFYNAGGGEDAYKDPLKRPLNLNEQEQHELVEFLMALSGRQSEVKLPL